MDNCSPPSLRYGEALKITTTPSDVGYFGVDYVRVQWNQIIEELRQWQQLQVDAKLALAA